MNIHDTPTDPSNYGDGTGGMGRHLGRRSVGGQETARDGVAADVLIDFGRVKTHVFGLRQHLQVLQPVISSVAVAVMHYLARLKVATEVLFHHKPMLQDVPPDGSPRMVRSLDVHPSAAHGPTTTPLRILRAGSSAGGAGSPTHLHGIAGKAPGGPVRLGPPAVRAWRRGLPARRGRSSVPARRTDGGFLPDRLTAIGTRIRLLHAALLPERRAPGAWPPARRTSHVSTGAPSWTTFLRLEAA